MEHDPRLPSGEWSGFYLESHRSQRGWMHLYLTFADGVVRGEGTDYVGPWIASGSYDTESGGCQWTKQYLGKHTVTYRGRLEDSGIRGRWKIAHSTGDFHIWPSRLREQTERYLKSELDQPVPPGDWSANAADAFL